MQFINLAEWADTPLVIQIHAVTAVFGLIVGALVFLRPKGTPLHRWMGRAFAIALVVVLGTSMFIHEIRLWGIWSPIHLLTLMTTCSLVISIRAVRQGDVARHAKWMRSIFVLGFVVAGSFTLLPGRLLHEVLLERALYRLAGGDVALANLIGASIPVIVCLCVAVLLWRGARFRPQPQAGPIEEA